MTTSEAYRQAYRALNDAQKQAVNTIDGPVLVIAGPGTGKTQLLSVRVANILHTAAVLPQNILCLTFTESGQRAMRERLVKFIGPEAYGVTISTYHAFGNEIIQRYPEFNDSSLGQRPIDDLLHDSLLREVMEGLPFSNPLRRADVYLRDVSSMISDAKRALLKPEDLESIITANQQLLDNVQEKIRSTLGSFTRINKGSVRLFRSIYDLLAAVGGNAVTPSIPNLGSLAATELGAAIEITESTGKTTALTKWKNVWLEKNNHGDFVLIGKRTNQRLLALAEIYKRYEKLLEKRAIFDYDDMIIRAVKAIEDNEDFKYTLQEQYQYILLDEFQDTNAAQYRLVELLTDNPVNEGRPNVLAVGDDDQAIYAFQGASYSNMRYFITSFPQTIVIPLTENYRSHSDILTIAGNVASQIEQRLHNSIKDIKKQLIAKGKGLPSEATIECHELSTEVSELSWIARKVENLIQKGVATKEIAVLAPKHKYLEALVPFLRAKNIPISYEKRENILDDPALQELITMVKLIQALANNNEVIADALWPQVLSYKFWNLSTERIWDISWRARFDSVPWRTILMRDATLKPIALFFTALALQSKTETIESLLDHLVGAAITETDGDKASTFVSPFYEYYFGDKAQKNNANNFWNLLTHFTVLRSRLRDHKANDESVLTIDDFLSFIDAHIAANIKIMSTAPQQSGNSGVQLMTAYKAKGLEFDTVFVMSCQDEVWGSGARSGSSLITLPKNLQHIRYAGTTEDERLRLLFVAITRARHRLYLSSHQQTYSGKQTNRLKYLLVQEDSSGNLQSRVLPETKQAIRQTINTKGDSIEDLTNYWHQRHTEALAQPALKDILASKIENWQMSVSHINTFLDIIYSGPQALFMNSILRFPRMPIIDGIYGDCIHETIYWLHRQFVKSGDLPAIEQAINHFTATLAKRRLSSHDYNLLTERGIYALKNYLAERATDFQIDDKHEVDFRQDGIVLDGIRVTGKIDKLRIDPQTKTITITDFKTGKSYAHWKTENKLSAYKRQLYFYKMLVEHSRQYSGYTVEKGVIDFVEPDENGDLHQLELTFNVADEKELRRLLRIVWQHISTLSFPDISKYPKTINGIKQFSEDLLNS